MKWNVFIFIAGFILAFAAGYFIFGADGTDKDSATPDSEKNEQVAEEPSDEKNDDTTDAEITVDADIGALDRNGCLSCHAVEKAGLEGGTTGTRLI